MTEGCIICERLSEKAEQIILLSSALYNKYA